MVPIRGPQVSTYLGSTEVRPFQVGFPAQLTSAWNSSTGYSWRQLLLSGVTVGAESAPLTGDTAVTPDNDTALASGTKGWLEPDPQAGGWYFFPAPTSSGSVSAAESVLGASVTLSGSFSDVLTLSLPAAGDYVIDGIVSVFWTATPTGAGLYPRIDAHLFDDTAAAELTGTRVVAGSGNQTAGVVAAGSAESAAPLGCLYTASAAVDIKIRALVTGSGSGSVLGTSFGPRCTRLRYTKY